MPEVVVDAYCSSGTYIRSLANDLGEALGTGAYLIGLRRTKSGRFTLREAVPLRSLKEAFQAGDWYQFLIPASDALGDWPMVELDADQVDLVRHGHRIPAEPEAEATSEPEAEPETPKEEEAPVEEEKTAEPEAETPAEPEAPAEEAEKTD